MRILFAAFLLSVASPALAQRQPAVPPGVEFLTDIQYREGNKAWRLDLAKPKAKSKTPRPGIVFVHGGGWRGGSRLRGQWRRLPIQYAQKGYVCITIDYRLSGEAAFPACVEDVKCAVRWFRANAAKHNLDPKRIGGYGNSAGAHLVAMLGLVGPKAKLEGDGPHRDQSSLLQAVCCSATPADFSAWRGVDRWLSRKGHLLAGDEKTLQDRIKRASPTTYAHKDAPPFLIIHGTADRTVPVAQGDALEKALKGANAKDVTYMKIADEGHGVFFRQIAKTGPVMEKFFARTLKNK